MKRIAIIGSTGSGKSTLAKRLSQALAAPVVELDSLYWLPGWIERDEASFRKLVDAATAPERWIVEGGYSEVRDLVWGRADTIVWINLPFRTTAWQLVRRTWRRNVTGEPCCGGNRESWRLSFSRESILLWLLKSYWRNLRRFPLALNTYGVDRTVIILRSRAQVDAFEWRVANSSPSERPNASRPDKA